MNFSFELEGAAMTGNITPDMMNSMAGAFGMFFGGLAMMRIVISLLVEIFMIISRWRVFKKAGFPGRGYLIPFYNRYLIFKIGGMSGWNFLWILIPPVFAILMIINYFNIAKKFGKHWAYGLGLLFVRIVFIPILAFDDSKYLGKKAIAKPIAKPIAKTITKPVAKVITKPVAKAPVKKAPAKKTPAKKVVKKVKTLTKKK